MSLGIYFGPKGINIVELKAKKIINNIQIPNSALAVGGLDDKVPEEVKTVAVLKEKLREKRIENKEAVITLSSKDLIIRTFGIPVLPSGELASAINFEAKKYIPFKIEELISNYQVQLDKLNRRYYVLFVGIKKEILQKYLSIMHELNIRISSIEYSAFSILRILEAGSLKDKGIVGMINIDAEEGDEAAFTVLENGFPLFSCDIKLASVTVEGSQTVKNDGMASEKFKTEIRISLDYYNHKFPGKRLKHIFLIGSPEYSSSIGSFMQELDLAFKYIDPSKIIDKTVPFSLSFLKGYSSALAPAVRSNVKVDILTAYERSKQTKTIVPDSPLKMLLLIVSDLKLDPMILISAVLICIVSFIFGIIQKSPLQRELNTIIALRPQTPSAGPLAGNEELQGIDASYRENVISMDTVLKKQLYLTPQLSALPGLLPKGMWLESFNFVSNEGSPEFVIRGIVYLGDNNKELEAINNLLLSLKKNPVFGKIFNEISVISADTLTIEEKTATGFTITGRDFQVKS